MNPVDLCVMAPQFRTTHAAAFITTREGLHTAFPGWRAPLAQPAPRMGRNAFTFQPMLMPATYDPDPAAASPAVPRELPFTHVMLPPAADWEQRYLALDLALSREPAPGAELWDPDDEIVLWEAMEKRGLNTEPLFGGLYRYQESPSYLWIVPGRIVGRLVGLSAADLERELAEWNARSQSPNPMQDLEALWSLARLAQARHEEMFIWQIHAHCRGLPVS
jgi:hypothetical protein